MAEVGEIPWWRYAVGNDFYASRTSTTAYRRFDDAVNSHAAKIADEAFVAKQPRLEKESFTFSAGSRLQAKRNTCDKEQEPCYTLHELE